MRYVGILAVLGSWLHAATLQQLSMEDVILKSTAIVSGKVVGQATLMRGPVIYTRYRVHVADQWKGIRCTDVDVFVPGGKHGSAVQTFSGSPSLQEGQDYLLFLWTSRNGLTQVIGLTQGLFEMKRDSKGEPVLLRLAGSDTMLDSSGKVVEDSPVSLRLREMVDRIQRSLAGVGR
ncbi:MAG TPA: hypothetical protein VM120_24185 [Bryobacteraceae bacterium]|nr:hypothetical protein [Bryobacteraceae bacterium]